MNKKTCYDYLEVGDCTRMGRKRLPEDERKERLTISLPNWMIQKLKKEKGYNRLIEDLLLKYHFNGKKG